MIKKLSLNFVNVCFAFLMVFIAGGCTNKAMQAPELAMGDDFYGDCFWNDFGDDFEEKTVCIKAAEAPKTGEAVAARQDLIRNILEKHEEETVSQQFRGEPYRSPDANDTQPDLFYGEPNLALPEMVVASATKVYESSPDLTTIHFNFNRYGIRPGDREILNRNAAWLNSNPDAFIRIEGHCDARGTPDYNRVLGDWRANATKDYLLSLGVDPSRISTVTYGKERPLCLESIESCWSQNRRAEFLVAK